MLDISAFRSGRRAARSSAVPYQPMLPGFPEPSVATVGLFIAVVPTREAVERAERIAEVLASALCRPGGRVRGGRLHVTMQHLGYYERPPQGVTAVAEMVLSDFSGAAFNLIFDRVVGRYGPLVLRGGAMDDAAEVQRRLRERLARGGLAGVMRRADVPHMTLWYESGVAGVCHIEPIGWPARRLILVRSWLGQGRHERIAECILRG